MLLYEPITESILHKEEVGATQQTGVALASLCEEFPIGFVLEEMPS